MANCDKQFRDYCDKISFDKDERESLADSRNAIRDLITDDFKKYDGRPSPDYHGQGSFMMKTIIKRLDGNHDLDDGVYFAYPGDDDETPTPETFHRWIHDAVDGHTTMETQEKYHCVRIQYKAGHHVDLAIYRERGSKHPELASTNDTEDDWIVSDAREFYEWFNEQTKESEGQLRRVIKYLKAWALYKKVPMKGITLTILAAKDGHYSKSDRDDEAFLNTLKNIKASLDLKFECFRPTAPTDQDLLKPCRGTNKETQIKDAFDALINSGNEAMDHPVQKNACQKWSKYFDSRFDCSGASEELTEGKHFSQPAFIKSDARSA